ncbi:MAG: type II secretion system protein N [Rhodoferax sp.]|nr:type II secretion system protein N [Rhodoferax sp.]
MPSTRPFTATRAPWRWAWAGAALGWALALLVFAPARWLSAPLAAATGGQLLLGDALGTVWSGSGQLTLTGGSGSSDASTLPGRVAWDIGPTWGKLNAHVRADCCMQSPLTFRLSPLWGGARLDLGDQRSQWPALWLTGLGTPWNTIRAEGQLALTTTGFGIRLAAGRLHFHGQAALDATNITSRLSTLQPMGSYRFELVGGEVPVFTLRTTQGSLQLSGQGQWTAGRLRFVGEASAAPEREDALSNLLNIIGRRQGARSIIQWG